MHHSPKGRRALSSVDRAWLRMDEPTNLMTITAVLVLAEPLDIAALRRLAEERLAPIDRFRQRVTHDRRGRSHWEHDPFFSVDQHVRPLTLPEPGNEAALQQAVGRLMSVPLDPEHPLWQLNLVESFAGGSAIIARLHHCIADGVALMLVLLSLTETKPDKNGDGESSNPWGHLFRHQGKLGAEGREIAEALLPEIMALMSRASKGSRSSRPRLLFEASSALSRLILRPSDPATPFRGSLGIAKKAAWSAPLPLADIKRLKSSLGGTLNDVLLTAVTGGLRRYLEQGGAVSDGLDIRAAVPISLRPLEQLHELGNRFGLVFLSLPVGIDDPCDRLEAIRQRMEELKGSLEAGIVYGMLGGMGHTPARLQDLLVRVFGTKASAVMTNVPGPRRTLYLAGRPLEDLIFWVPQSGRVGLGISIASYAGKIRLGIATDAGLIPAPAKIIEGFQAELEALAAAN